MIYLVEIPDEAAIRLEKGKRVTGVIAKDQVTGNTAFKAFSESRKKKRDQDILICPLATGWLKGSKQRYKLFLSVNKAIGAVRTEQVMTNELNEAMAGLLVAEAIADYENEEK